MSLDEIYRRMNDDMENFDDTIDLNDSQIRNFYAGKSILVTGATGYVGRVFIEKILRDCRQLRRLYVIVRTKNDTYTEDIIKKYFEHVTFENLRRTNPSFSDKVVTINGDLQSDDLDLFPEDRQTLIDDIDLIIHTAAITKFDEKLNLALKVNVLGTKNLLDLAMDCRHIQAFVHVSTGYSHCYKRQIDEIFYPPPCDLDKVYNLIRQDELNCVTPEGLKKILGKWPNVYIFSKAIAEGLVKKYGENANFAVGVYRPTIVIPSYREPMPGWIANENGPTLIFTSVGLGVLHAFYIDSSLVEDMIPVDFVANSLIAVVYDLVQQWQTEKKPLVYNFGSSTTNPVSLTVMSRIFLEEGPKIGSTRLFWYPFSIFIKSIWQFWILHILFHFIPAVIYDICRLCVRKKPRAVKIFMFVSKNLDKIDYFGNGDWRIKSDKSMALYDRLNKADKTIFDFDVRKLDWQTMSVIYMRGVRLYLLNEPLDNIEVARKKYLRMKILHYTLSSVILMIFCWLFLRFLCNIIY